MRKSLFHVKLVWHQNKKGGNNYEKSEIANKLSQVVLQGDEEEVAPLIKMTIEGCIAP